MGRGFGVWGFLPALEAQPRKFFRAASQAPLCALGIFNIPGGCGRGARCRTGCPVPDGLPSSPRLCRDGWDGVWCAFRGCGCPFPPIPWEPRAAPLTGVPRGPCASPGGSSASFTSVDLLWDEGLRLLVLAGCRTLLWCSRTRPSLPHPPLQTPRARLCQATAPALLPRLHQFPALLQLLGTTLAVSAAPPGAWDPPGPGRKPPALGDKRKRQRLLPPCEDLGPLPGRKALRALGTLGVQRGQGGARCVVRG